MRFRFLKTTLGMFLIVVLLAGLLSIGCGNKGETPQPPAPSPTSSPGPSGNQPPTIAGITAEAMQVYPEGTVEIRVDVSDPDNDKMTFTWSTTGGRINGTGHTVDWQAPEQKGDFDVTVVVEDGNGGSAQDTITLNVTTNQSPMVSSVVADPSTVGPGGRATLTCEASDPDGEIVSYEWKPAEGTITGQGNKVTYFAPDKEGTFEITITVKDDNDSEAVGNVSVSVVTSSNTVTLNTIPEETGTIASNGDRDKTKTWTGDDADNIGYRCFWSFNLFSLNGKIVKDAKLIFTTKSISGKPFSKIGPEALGGLKIWQVKYSDGIPAFDTTGFTLADQHITLHEEPNVIDVTNEVAHLVDAASNRFQIEALFNKAFNGNGAAEWIEWSEVILEVTYTEK